MRNLIISMLGLFSVALLVPAEASSEADASAGNARPSTVEQDRDLVMRNFVMGFLTRAQQDTGFRDACLADLPDCLAAAGKTIPEGHSFDYQWDAEAGHSVRFTEEGGTERVVRVGADGEFDSGPSKGFAARATQDEFDRAYLCCWTGQEATYCRIPKACSRGQQFCESPYFAQIIDGAPNKIPCTW